MALCEIAKSTGNWSRMDTKWSQETINSPKRNKMIKDLESYARILALILRIMRVTEKF